MTGMNIVNQSLSNSIWHIPGLLFFSSAFPVISNAAVINVPDMCNYSDSKVFSLCYLDNLHEAGRAGRPVSVLHDWVLLCDLQNSSLG